MNIFAIRGDDEEYTVTLTEEDDPEVPLDLTDYDLRFTAKYDDRDDDDSAVISKRTGSGITVDSPESGEAVIAVDAADTEELGHRTTLVYDLQARNTLNGKVKTPLRGTLTVLADVTNTRS